jgi:hypothetical protein
MYLVLSPLQQQAETIHMALGCQVVNDRLLDRKKPILHIKPK